MPNFRPELNILPVDFGGWFLLLLLQGKNKVDFLDLSLGLGLEFDNKLT